MTTENKLKILNDPIYGFITIPSTFLYDLIEHPYFQRLRRIKQMGLSSLVYPGAEHTRFHHALGCMHMMQKAIQVLRSKEVAISKEEEEAVYIAILLHDIGHGPFSHAMEHSIVEDIQHEEISLLFMNALNEEFQGKLSLAIQIFTGDYHRKFLIQLISSQMDMDRMDYLKRDSFYSGVAEGNINSERLIQMINVHNDLLVVEEKGIYSVEKFLVARRLMYWQCYLHKTSVGAELLLSKILKRAKQLTLEGVHLPASDSLKYFLKNSVSKETFNADALLHFSLLDDADIITALKNWQFHNDEVLSYLSSAIVNRKLFHVKLVSKADFNSELNTYKTLCKDSLHVGESSLDYFVFGDKLKNQAYDLKAEPIRIFTKSKEIIDVLDASDQYNLKALSEPVYKYFICYPKSLYKVDKI
ncbi:HD domain-containing protein [Flavobacterium sp. xlx-214]|uniref:HD domain-containing protein n=1 Tax=unclassified Flavobacterium TaxID=196869 RepID=UPI0013CFBB28|nr:MULTISPECIES: HD domain-containing protein [unclassified Flavobacterium]MBA5791474.1 HD domain-containing protein [Flavobacterium sp. xlx-221]QMI83376.1 HD domain-containing protein [Flavobacterium sp. xlx-214]